MPHMEGLQKTPASKASLLQSVKQDAAEFAGAAHTGLPSPAVVSRQSLVLTGEFTHIRSN